MGKPTLLATAVAIMSCMPGTTKNSPLFSIWRRMGLAMVLLGQSVSEWEGIEPGLAQTLLRLEGGDLRAGILADALDLVTAFQQGLAGTLGDGEGDGRAVGQGDGAGG